MGLFSPFVNAIKTIVSAVGGKINFTQLITSLVSIIPNIIESIGGLKSADAKRIIDDSLTEFDNLTGIEGNLDAHIYTDVPVEVREQINDHFKEMVRLLAYNKAKVDGYYI